MSNTNERYNFSWYKKRIDQNKIIKDFLIKIIERNKEADFPFTKEQITYLNYEDLFELAVATVNKSISITLGAGQDLSHGYDCKFSIVRMNGGIKNPKYTAGITGCENKKSILACVYENIQQKFYFFAFPASLSEHSIPFNRETGNPIRYNYMWKQYECKTFEEMALDARFTHLPENASSPVLDSETSTKNHPNLQSTSLCIEENGQLQIPGLLEIQPICPSD
jgi:hypothetical protein